MITPNAVSAAPRKICFIAGTLGRGGAERQLFYILSSLIEKNIDCRVLCLTHGEPYEKKIRDLGIPVIWVGRAGFPLVRFFTIIDQVRRWQPDIVQSAHSYTSLYAIVAALACRKVGVAAMRSQGLEEYLKLGLWGKLSLLLSKNIVGNSRQAVDSLRMRFPAKQILLLNNAVDCAAFSPNGIAASQSEKVVHVLACGRLVSPKRLDIFLKAFALAREFSPRLRASIVGDGPLRDDLITFAKQLNIQDHITFVVGTDKVADYYRKAHVFVLASDYEGTPNVVLEAMACGLPVIATAVGGVKELVRHEKTGYLVPTGDFKQIADHVVTLAGSSELREQQGKIARSIVEEEYCLSSLGDRLLELYATILGK